MSGYAFDEARARKANGGSLLKESGAFGGRIISAWDSRNEKGTRCFNLQFEAKDGRKTPTLKIYTVNGEGKELHGLSLVDSLLPIVGVRGISAREGKVVEYDFDRKEDVERVEQETFPSLANKPVGVFLQVEQYAKDNGEAAEQLNCIGFFDPETHLVASEILDKSKEAKTYARQVSWLEKNPVKVRKSRSGGSNYTPPSQQSKSSFEDDDIPF